MKWLFRTALACTSLYPVGDSVIYSLSFLESEDGFAEADSITLEENLTGCAQDSKLLDAE